MRAHRIEDGKVRTEHLASSAMRPLSWSPSGSWMTYLVTSTRENAQLKARRFDGDRWYEPVTLSGPSGRGAPSSIAWSPTRDQLLVTDRVDRSESYAIAMPRPDGSFAMRPLVTPDMASTGRWQSGARWAPSGDRVVVVWNTATGERRVTVFDVSATDDLTTTAHEITPPAGASFSAIEPTRVGDETVRDGMISPDGLWMVFVVQQEGDEAAKALHAFSTTGASPPRVLEGCPVSAADGGASRCRPYAWVGDSTLLIERVGAALEAWTPATDSRSSFADLSPDGRWLVLSHAELQSDAGWLVAVDLHAPGPLSAREIFRGARGEARTFTFSPRGTSIVVHRASGSSEVARGTWIELATGHVVTVDVAVPPRKKADPSLLISEWRPRIGSDDRTLAIARGDTLALWQLDRPQETAVVLEGVPATAHVTWLPAR